MGSSKDWKKTKTIYWSDEINDDFDEVGLSRPQVPKDYPYERRNIINTFFSGILYHGIVKPILGTYCFFKGIRYEGKENLKLLGGRGAFLYANHVAITDVFKYQSQLFFFRRRVNIFGYPDSLTIPVVKHLVRALGYLPVPSHGDLRNMIKLTEACKFYLDKKQFLLIYPEAHIWPYYTKIRNFPSGSFNYPSKYMAPVVPLVTTWRKPLIGKKPKQTIIVGKPIFPKKELTQNENKQFLYEECLTQMKEMANSVKQYEYIKYIKKENSDGETK